MYQSQDASRDRKRLRDLAARLAELIGELLCNEPIWRGIVYEHRRRCGKPNCRCARGELHESFTFADRSERKQRNRSLSGELLREARRLTEAYRRARRARAELNKLLAEIQAAADRLEAYRLDLGQKKLGPKLREKDEA